MYALPPNVTPGELHVTGLPCPDCSGVLGVRALGAHASLVFECRVGHTYDLPELLTAKEEVLERKLWAAATALVELSALMNDLEGRTRSAAEAAIYETRGRQARARADTLLKIIQRDSPIQLSAVVRPVRASADSVRSDAAGPSRLDGELGAR
jgi:hypothetical protein